LRPGGVIPLVIPAGVPVVEFRLPSKGGHFDDLSPAEENLDQAEAAADGAAVAKQLAHFAGPGVGGDVEILWSLPQQDVPDPSAHEIGDEAKATQPVEHLQGVRIDELS